MSASSKAVYLQKPVHLDTWQRVDASAVPLVKVTKCPCCQDELKDIAVLTEKSHSATVAIGHCADCGYIGYTDKPTADWVADFYNETWDTDDKKTVETVVPFSSSVVVKIIKELGTKDTDSIFDIGAGYGQVLKQCREEGYKNLHGSEHSPHRAQVASEYAGARVTHTPFTPDNLKSLQENGPHDLMFSKSVMEHMYEPDELFATASVLQKPGGKLIVLVPNTDFESFLNVAFFLPHLHSFSKQSLVKLAERHNYVATEVREYGTGICLIAEKNSEAKASPSQSFSDRSATLERWSAEMQLEHLGKSSSLFWINSRDSKQSGVLPVMSAYLYKLLSRLPEKYFLIMCRVFLKVPRRHHSYLLSLAEGNFPDESFQIIMDKLFLNYK